MYGGRCGCKKIAVITTEEAQEAVEVMKAGKTRGLEAVTAMRCR